MSTHAKRVLLADDSVAEARVVKDRPPVFLRVHDRLQVHKVCSAIERQTKLAREWANRDVADGHRGAVALADDPTQTRFSAIWLR